MVDTETANILEDRNSKYIAMFEVVDSAKTKKK